MFHSRDSPRLLVCDTGLYMEQNDIGFITVAICGGYISEYPRLILHMILMMLLVYLYVVDDIRYKHLNTMVVIYFICK